jgi:hypothetical protein
MPTFSHLTQVVIIREFSHEPSHMRRRIHADLQSSNTSSDYQGVQSFFASQTLHNRKFYNKKKSGAVNYEAMSPLFFS